MQLNELREDEKEFLMTEKIKIVQKVWGKEHWIVNREYAGKKMVLYKGKQCSLHFHKIKDETFYVIKGRVLMECMGERRIMLPGDSQLILPNAPHRFTGISEENAEIIEFSTHHYDELDTDNFRLVPSQALTREIIKNPAIYITGDRGYLGRALKQQLKQSGRLVCGSDIEFFDITNRKEFINELKSVKPRVIIHTAALSDWLACETYPEMAHKINVNATQTVANYCQTEGIPLVYISTDFIFSGAKGNYVETAIPDPINVYGRTKAAAEDVVRKLDEHLIVRAGTYYGVSYFIDRPVFAHKLLRKLQGGEEYCVATDELSNPTLIQGIADVLDKLINGSLWGTWHLGGADKVSRFDFAHKIAKVFNLNAGLIRGSTIKQLNSDTRRPVDVSLSMAKLNTLGIYTHTLQSGLVKMKRDYAKRETLLMQELK